MYDQIKTDLMNMRDYFEKYLQIIPTPNFFRNVGVPKKKSLFSKQQKNVFNIACQVNLSYLTDFLLLQLHGKFYKMHAY